jgi:predicted MFS family arabinose efflux permease
MSMHGHEIADGEAPQPSVSFDGLSARAALVLTVLLLINVVNFIDRQLPFILMESIKKELRLSDSEIGLLAGMVFALVYSVAALVLAWVSDRWSARRMLVITLSVWSAFTALSGLARNFAGLLGARMAVSASEAGSTPAAHALISGLFPVHRRAFALAVFSLGVPLGSMLGLALGGWISDVADWRTAFLVVGTPGLVLALSAWLVLPEAVKPMGGVSRPDTGGVRALLRLRSFRHMAAGSALYACGSYAINVFAASFLIRVHGLSTTQAGLAFGLAFGLGGLAGTFLGGVISDVLGQRDPRWRQLVPAVGQLLSFPTALGTWLVPDVGLSIALLALSYVLGLTYYAPTFAAAQQLASEGERATASALLLFCLTFIGSSLGPIVVGWASDRLAPQFGALSLRYALCLMGITILWSAWHFWCASRVLGADLERAH